MRILSLLLGLFIIVPLVELTLLVYLGYYTRPWVSILLVICSGFVGALLTRFQGWNTIRQIRQDLSEGRMPTNALLDGVFILVAGGMLLTPGVLTDLLGMSMMIPPIRSFYKSLLVRWFKSKFTFRTFQQQGGPHSQPPRNMVVEERPLKKNDAD